jgi:hypothetical protein
MITERNVPAHRGVGELKRRIRQPTHDEFEPER